MVRFLLTRTLMRADWNVWASSLKAKTGAVSEPPRVIEGPEGPQAQGVPLIATPRGGYGSTPEPVGSVAQQGLPAGATIRKHVAPSHDNALVAYPVVEAFVATARANIAKAANPRERRAWADNLYAATRHAILGTGYTDSHLGAALSSLPGHARRELLAQAGALLSKVPGFGEHASRLRDGISNAEEIACTQAFARDFIADNRGLTQDAQQLLRRLSDRQRGPWSLANHVVDVEMLPHDQGVKVSHLGGAHYYYFEGKQYVVQFLRDHVKNNDSLPDRAKQVLKAATRRPGIWDVKNAVAEVRLGRPNQIVLAHKDGKGASYVYF